MTTIIWGILRMNSKILCASNQSVRAAPRNMIGTIISISLQGLKEMMNFTVAPTICSLWKSHVLEDHTKILRSAVSTCLNLMIMVFIYSPLDSFCRHYANLNFDVGCKCRSVPYRTVWLAIYYVLLHSSIILHNLNISRCSSKYSSLLRTTFYLSVIQLVLCIRVALLFDDMSPLSPFFLNKGQCRGCTYNKRVDLKHPNNADEYTGGHLDPYLPYGGDTTIQDSSPDENLDPEEEEAMLQAKEEARLKRIYKCLDDPKFLEKMRRRFKDDPRAEAFFQPQKSRDPQHGTPLADVQ